MNNQPSLAELLALLKELERRIKVLEDKRKKEEDNLKELLESME